MWQRLDGYIKAIWDEYRIWGFVVIVAVALVVLIVAALVLGIDVGGFVNDWMGQ